MAQIAKKRRFQINRRLQKEVFMGVLNQHPFSVDLSETLDVAHGFSILHFYQPLQFPWNQGLHLICRNPAGDEWGLSLVF
jgi:hypothetical protein